MHRIHYNVLQVRPLHSAMLDYFFRNKHTEFTLDLKNLMQQSLRVGLARLADSKSGVVHVNNNNIN